MFRSLKPGDHIAVQTRKYLVKYTHHAIFISHKEGVIEFDGEDKNNATIRSRDFFKFKEGTTDVTIMKYPRPLPSEHVVKTAKRFLENPGEFGSYDILTNNCEHFATYCKIGFKVSIQVTEKIKECLENPLNVVKYALTASSIGVLQSSRRK